MTYMQNLFHEIADAVHRTASQVLDLIGTIAALAVICILLAMAGLWPLAPVPLLLMLACFS
ncbi:MAG: hypothetical protein IT536_05310 [Hyphomicrobiales bacterium]|nr:hypothetical protein [Hyphomicrobiales bacterium]